MSLKLVGNSDFFANSKIDSYQSLKLVEPKASLGNTEMEALIDVLPETHVLENMMDNFYYNLHEDSKLPLFSDIFHRTLSNNSTALQNLNPSSKAQILFNKYVEFTLSQLSNQESFKKSFDSLYKKAHEILKENIDENMTAAFINANHKSRINRLHSSFITVAIAKALDVQPEDIQFSSKCPSVDLTLPNIDLGHSLNSQAQSIQV